MARNAPGSFAVCPFIVRSAHHSVFAVWLFGGSAFTKEYVLGVADYSQATWSQNFIASVAGAVASIAVAAPLDTVKTRIQNANFEQKVPGVDGRKGPRSQRGRFSVLQGLDTKGTLGRVQWYLTDPLLRFPSRRVIDSCRWPEAGLQLYPRSVVDTFLWQVRLE